MTHIETLEAAQSRGAGEMESPFAEQEKNDGLRFAWNAWPSSRIEATRVVAPFGVMVTPLKEISGMPVLPYEPVACKQCSAVLNPYARVDYAGKIWICQFCFNRNHFPAHYASISENNLPAELFPNYSVVEYTLQHKPSLPPAFLFVLDTCQGEEELSNMKDSIAQVLQMIPDHTLVGLITYGSMVHVHELGSQDCPKQYVFRGDDDLSGPQV
eukprot:CAMPEP_0182870918 /NCGR_PEP_ID=MMETSP0034_2-20130328/10817_1 /TAXON_ID=156128 /ORGANISM="Nephroselmis pyriformis, Strain CCMP717" /LENGTH=212 /DNA_ID=CAMNT_0025003435 /DNA_START=155 /DNA_END=791 /DNA_ORIENTATION=-